MGVKVVDASAVGALLFNEPEANLMAVRLAGARLTAPALLPFEVTNIALKKILRHPEQRPLLLAAFAMLPQLPIDIVGVDQDAVLGLAEQTGLTAYDAGYLWLARNLDAELVTLDKRLLAASAGR
jgi:predicted nucleic acid-binding protein